MKISRTEELSCSDLIKNIENEQGSTELAIVCHEGYGICVIV